MKAIDPSFDPSFLPALQSETAGTGAGTGERSEARRRRGFWIAVIPAVGIAWFFGYPLYRVFQSLRALEAKGRQDFPAPTPGTRVPGYFTREKLYSAYRREQNADGMLRMTELKFKEDPNNLSVKHQVAGLLLVTGRQIDRAGRLAKELYESNPKSLQNATLYAFSLHLQGESTKAAELLDSRRDLQNLSNDGASYYALILSACGRGDEARHILAGVKRELLLPELREALDRAVAPASAIPR
jgi:tetratricopeptide (TPR) repeat protein